VSDTRLREARRRWERTRDVHDEATYLLERVRGGELSHLKLRAAAYGGVPAAALAYAQRSLEDFTALVREIPWFVNLGKASARDAEVIRIHDWDEWRGPEYYEDFFLRGQANLDELLAAARGDATLTRVREEVDSLVHGLAARHVAGYDPNQDAWHGPSLCVWHGAWDASLLACHAHRQTSPPSSLAQEWFWFVDGHWPCGFDGDKNRLVVL
jgi:hypothetical protein